MSARLLFAGLVALSLVLFLVPVSPGGPEGSDKVGHAVVFAVLALAGGRAGIRPVALALGLAAYGVAVEVLQATLPIGRLGDPADFAADLVGLAVGMALTAALAARLTPARRGRRGRSRPRG